MKSVSQYNKIRNSYYLYDYYAGTRGKEENKYIYQDIVNDPRYETQIRPKLEALGFKFYEDVGGEKSEIWCINTRDSSTKGHSECSEIWNHVVDLMEIEAVNECVLEPLQKYYPDGTVSDYKVGAQDTWNRATGTHGGEVIFNTIGAGNVSNWLLYAGNPENAYFGWGTSVYDNPPSYNDAEFKATPFNMFLYDINYFKNMYASTDDGRIDAWVANYEYGVGLSGYPSTFSGTPYYTEALFHVGLMNPEVYLGYIIDSDYINSCKVVSDILLELTRLVGASDRKPLKPQASWNGSYVLSGMYAAGRNVWRITPDTDVVSLKDFKISSNNEDPTFSIDGLTITFPGGKILKDGDIRMAGSCGYWIETAQDVEPVISATGGVNTHKGAIYTLGILCGSVGRLWSAEQPIADSSDILAECANIVRTSVPADLASAKGKTAGEQLYLQQGIRGIRGEIAEGLPSVRNIGLPRFRQFLADGFSENDAGVYTLLHLIANVADTTLYKRGGKAGAQWAAKAAGELLSAVRYPSIRQIEALDDAFIARNLSPGGCADLLAATYFLRKLTQYRQALRHSNAKFEPYFLKTVTNF